MLHNLTFWIYVQKKLVYIFIEYLLTLTYGYEQHFELLLCEFKVKLN